MFKILLIVVITAAILCLCIVIACLFAMVNENEYPDIEDVETG